MTTRSWTDLHAAAGALDRSLGDPADPANPCGFRAMADRTRADELPVTLAERAAALRLSFIPVADGGDLGAMDEALALVRVAARRDPTVMPTTMISITAAAVLLVSGSDRQKADLVRLLRNGGSVTFARADQDGDPAVPAGCRILVQPDGGVRLDGEMDFVGFVPTTAAVLVLAPTGSAAPGALTAVLLRNEEVGIRHSAGRFLGGIEFARLHCDIAAGSDAVVGPPGRAMGALIPALQLVSTFSLAGHLAAADTALRVAADFAADHRLGRRPVGDEPFCRRRLGTAAAALIAADAVSLVSARTMHTLPETAAVRSLVAKKVVGELAADAIRWCGEVQSTAAPVRADGTLDALVLHNNTIGYLDTSPLRSVKLLTPQLLSMAADTSRAPVADPPGADALRTACAVDERLPLFRPQALTVLARGSDPIIRGLPHLVDSTEKALPGSELAGLVRAVVAQFGRIFGDLADVASRGRPGQDLLLELTERFCYLYAAAECVHLWHGSHHLPLYGAAPGSPGWLTVTLSLLLRRAIGGPVHLPAAQADQALGVLEPLRRTGRLFAAVPVALSESCRPAGPGQPDTNVNQRVWSDSR